MTSQEHEREVKHIATSQIIDTLETYHPAVGMEGAPPTDAAAVVAMTPVATHAAATAMAIVAMKAAAADIDSIIS